MSTQNRIFHLTTAVPCRCGGFTFNRWQKWGSEGWVTYAKILSGLNYQHKNIWIWEVEDKFRTERFDCLAKEVEFCTIFQALENYSLFTKSGLLLMFVNKVTWNTTLSGCSHTRKFMENVCYETAMTGFQNFFIPKLAFNSIFFQKLFEVLL